MRWTLLAVGCLWATGALAHHGRYDEALVSLVLPVFALELGMAHFSVLFCLGNTTGLRGDLLGRRAPLPVGRGEVRYPLEANAPL